MSQIERLRKLQNRMRTPAISFKNTLSNQQPINNNQTNQEDSIKSSDSKKQNDLLDVNDKEEQSNEKKNENKQPQQIQMIFDNPLMVKEQNLQFVHMTEQQMNKNKKITDYFFISRKQYPSIKKTAKINTTHKDSDEVLKSQKNKKQEQSKNQIFAKQQQMKNQILLSDQTIQNNCKNISQVDGQNKINNQTENEINLQNEKLIQQNKLLKDKLKQKDEQIFSFKNQMKKDMLQLIIKIHKTKRNEIKMRVSQNKIRLGQYRSYQKGQDVWIDGTQIRQVKQKLQNINKQKEELQKAKKNQSRKPNQQQQQKKNAIACQMHFLTREQTHYQQILKRLQQQKYLHIKQYKLMFQQQRSRYGRPNPQTGLTNWPKIKQYQLLGLLGKGGFSQVYKAFDSQQLKQVAIKVHQFGSTNSTAKDNYIKHALRQNKVHKILIHPNIVRLYDTVQIDTTSFCTVLQYCQGPDLSYYLKKHKKLPEKEAKLIIRQVILAIKYLHELNDKVIHYDLKPQNILFHKGRIKITDFGLCKTTKQQAIQLTSQGVGTYWYLPPQCFVTDYKALITTKVDIWAIGVVYFQMIFGQKPFGDKMSQMRILNEGIMLKATQVIFPQTPKGFISNQSRQLIKSCLTWKTEDRANIQFLYEHPLFQKK